MAGQQQDIAEVLQLLQGPSSLLLAPIEGRVGQLWIPVLAGNQVAGEERIAAKERPANR